jgi:protein SDA1
MPAARQVTLQDLQNLIRRDPDGYADEFSRRLRQFESILAIVEQQPAAASTRAEFVPLLSFVAHVSQCYPKQCAAIPEAIGRLLETHHDALTPDARRALVQALVLLRNRGMIPALTLLQRCFRLFRCRDKALRERLYSHVITDIKTINQKQRDDKLNRQLQNFIISMLEGDSAVAAKFSLRAMIELYRKHVWRDAKTVNVVAAALFCPHSKLRVAALHFLLGAHDEATGEIQLAEKLLLTPPPPLPPTYLPPTSHLPPTYLPPTSHLPPTPTSQPYLPTLPPTYLPPTSHLPPT